MYIYVYVYVKYLKERQGIDVDVNTMFDIQVRTRPFFFITLKPRVE